MKTKTKNHLALWIGLPLLGCATTTQGAHPHDMSAAGHEATAQREGQTAEAHAGQYDPNAAVTRERCRPWAGGARRVDSGAPDTCWTSVRNPTDVHRRTAEEHRRAAADHRAASAVLRGAEARACGGVAPDDRDMSPFEHGEDITSVAPFTISDADARATGRLPNEQLLGAVVTFRAVPGMTAEWLQRVVNCHLARNASLGHVVPEMPNCPLVPNGVTARVSSVGDGFAVTIQSNQPVVAQEILSRAQRLTSASPASGR